MTTYVQSLNSLITILSCQICYLLYSIFAHRVVVQEESKPEEDEIKATEGEDGAAEAEEDYKKDADDIEDLDDEDDDEDELDPPPTDGGDKEAGMWEETFKTHHDSKPYGVCVRVRACVLELANV